MTVKYDWHKTPPLATLTFQHGSEDRHMISNRIFHMAADEDSPGQLSTLSPPSFARPRNRKYLRTVHNYDSTTSSTQSERVSPRTVSLRSGDLILVHLTHVNGWADGTVLNTGARGWLPTNYCEEFDHEMIRDLFHSVTRFWTACVSQHHTSIQPASAEDIVIPIVAGVRYLLVCGSLGLQWL